MYHFIGIVTLNDDIVEVVQMFVDETADATRKFSMYVYDTYNKDIPLGGNYYNGILRDLDSMKDISGVKGIEHEIYKREKIRA